MSGIRVENSIEFRKLIPQILNGVSGKTAKIYCNAVLVTIPANSEIGITLDTFPAGYFNHANFAILSVSDDMSGNPIGQVFVPFLDGFGLSVSQINVGLLSSQSVGPQAVSKLVSYMVVGD